MVIRRNDYTPQCGTAVCALDGVGNERLAGEASEILSGYTFRASPCANGADNHRSMLFHAATPHHFPVAADSLAARASLSTRPPVMASAWGDSCPLRQQRRCTISARKRSFLSQALYLNSCHALLCSPPHQETALACASQIIVPFSPMILHVRLGIR